MARWFKFRQPASEFERFASGAFNRLIGKDVPVTLPNGRHVMGKLIAAEVAPDGASAELTVELTTPASAEEGG